jgi:hypothetical protein
LVKENDTMTDAPKSLGPGLEIKTFRGRSGVCYLVFRTHDGTFHVFQDVDPQEACRDCAQETETDDRQGWEILWQRLRE